MEPTQKRVISLAAQILKGETSVELFDSTFELILQGHPRYLVLHELRNLVSGNFDENFECVGWWDFLRDAIDGSCNHLYKTDFESLWPEVSSETRVINKLLKLIEGDSVCG